MKRAWTFVGLVLAMLPSVVLAAGPQRLALSDRSLWPYPINSPAAFDQASRFEIAAFAQVLAQQSLDEGALREFVNLKAVDVASAHAWVNRTQSRLLDNFKHAVESCDSDSNLLCPTQPLTWEWLSKALSQAPLNEGLMPWREQAERFYVNFLYEQLRLASLHPRITSEIAKLDAAEILGFELPDREFMLTFDDGPTSPGGDTDRLLATLRYERVNATFFMLGEKLQQRLNLQSEEAVERLYTDMCPASHAYVHKSHAKLPDWQQSVAKTQKLLLTTFPQLSHGTLAYRPPYGQRVPEAAAFLAQQHERIVLWNIDSQDWNRHITAEQARDRVMTLMLLWRRGIILFHDIHAKAQTAIPSLVNDSRVAGVRWGDCHTLTAYAADVSSQH